MRIRKARAGDVQRLVELWWQLHTSHYRYDRAYYQLRPGRTARKKTAEHYEKQLRDPQALFLVAAEGSEIVGYALAHLVDRPPVFRPSKRLFIDTTIVAEAYRGTGVFRRLFSRLKRLAEARCATYMELSVDIRNPAFAVYAHMGFKARHYKMVYTLDCGQRAETVGARPAR